MTRQVKIAKDEAPLSLSYTIALLFILMLSAEAASATPVSISLWPPSAVSTNGVFNATLGGNISLDDSWIYPETHRAPHSDHGVMSDGLSFRRIVLNLSGGVQNFEFAFTEDLSHIHDLSSGLNDAWLAHSLGSGGVLMLGQHKPWRSLDELASSDAAPFLENNVLSSNGLFGGRNFTQGLYYRRVQNGVFGADDFLWLGTSVYIDSRDGLIFSDRAYGMNGRIAYAPVMAARQWLQLGASYSFDKAPAYESGSQSPGYGAPIAGYSTWYGWRSQPARVADFGAGPASSAATLTVELATTEGPLYLQAEFGTAQLNRSELLAQARAYSIELAYSLTGQARSYIRDKATYGALGPTRGSKAVELALRFDAISNYDLLTCALTRNMAATRCEVTSITAAVNYYIDPHTRLMLDYWDGLADAGLGGRDNRHGVQGQIQVTF